MLELPPSVKIGYRTYKIEPIEAHSLNDDGDYLLGKHDWQGVIHLSPHFKPTEVVNTLVHEVCHGLVDIYGYIFPDKEGEEKFVDDLSKQLTTLLVDNLDVFQWMIKTCQRDTSGKVSKAR